MLPVKTLRGDTHLASQNNALYGRESGSKTRPHRILAICAACRRLNGFVLSDYSVHKSSQFIRVAAQLRTVAAGVSLRVVASCGARRPAMATYFKHVWVISTCQFCMPKLLTSIDCNSDKHKWAETTQTFLQYNAVRGRKAEYTQQRYTVKKGVFILHPLGRSIGKERQVPYGVNRSSPCGCFSTP